jgi:hypothetical protein
VDSALTREQIDVAAARQELEAANEQLRGLAPQSPEAVRERARVDFATAKLTLTS